MGLDPPTLTTLSSLLQKLAIISSPRIVLSLRPQDFLPDWITHLMLLGHGLQILHQGPKESVPKELIKPNMESAQSLSQIKGSHSKTKAAFSTNLSAPSIKHERELNALSRDEPPFVNDELSDTSSVKEPLVEMENVQIKYEKKILGGWTKNRIGSADDGLSWTVRRGERWGIFGPNGK